MHVEASGWHTGRPGVVARQYKYSKLNDARDFELQVHFDIQAGLSIFTFLNFIISDLDVPHEMSMRGTLRPMDGVGPHTTFGMIARPDGSGAVLNVPAKEDVATCLKLFFEGKDMHFEGETTSGERLIKLPLPNDLTFRTAYTASYEKIRAADDAEFQGSDGIMGRLNRFMRGLSGEASSKPSSRDNASRGPGKPKTPPSLEATTWQISGGGHGYHLTRDYVFSGLAHSIQSGTLRLNISLESASNDINLIDYGVRIYIRPFQLSHNRTFVMGFFTAESKGGWIEVLAIPNTFGNDALLDVGLCLHKDDVPKFLRALSSGNELTFALVDPMSPESKPFLKPPLNTHLQLSLPKDLTFKRLFDETCENISQSQDATRARHLREGWYRRRDWE